MADAAHQPHLQLIGENVHIRSMHVHGMMYLHWWRLMVFQTAGRLLSKPRRQCRVRAIRQQQHGATVVCQQRPEAADELLVGRCAPNLDDAVRNSIDQRRVLASY